LKDGSFDTVAAILFLSAVPDQHWAISEIRRALRPGGRLLILDHARSAIAPVRWLQRLLNPLVARLARWEFMRDPLVDVTSAGFSVEEHQRSGVRHGGDARRASMSSSYAPAVVRR
jgi:ubiquinone/menaquinone biosynthesis C-methylase UbiE